MADGRVFHIGACLGRGGFGEVYRARMVAPTGFETEVALKVLRRDLDPGSQAVQRLRDEGRLLARLSHPAILRAFDLAVLDGRVALVTEYVEGEDLAEVVLRGPMAPRAALEVIARVAGALDAAWSTPIADGSPLRLVHRDIKPSNIRLSRHGDVKVLDFGIARTDQVEREARTATDMMVGSPPYMAPERFLDGSVRLASDVYALGATLYEALAGPRLFADQTVTMLAALAVHRDRHDAFVAEKLAPLPAGIVDLVRDCLAYDPEKRPSPAELESRADALADAAPGTNLARWARERAWPKPPAIAGELADRTLSEGSAAGSAAPPPPPPLAPARSVDEPRPRRWWMFGGALAGLGGIAVASLVGVVALAALAVALWPPPAAPDPAPPVVPVTAPSAVPSAPEPEPSAPAPAPAPSRGPAPAPAPAPVPDPEPGPPPAPVPAPEPPAPAPSGGGVSVRVVGATSVLLQTSGGAVRLPGEAPAGTWEGTVSWTGGELVPLKAPVTIPAGGPIAIECSYRLGRCYPR